jgi:hypothetical protein
MASPQVFDRGAAAKTGRMNKAAWQPIAEKAGDT